MNTELEKKVAELENLPGHILGLDGWFLRGLPTDARNAFLKDFQRAVAIAHHPDKTTNEGEKKRRERYLQAVSHAVSFLTSDPHSYEIATEDVPSARNPVVRLKNEALEIQAEMGKLENTLEAIRQDNQGTLRINKQLTQELIQMEEYVANISHSFEKNRILADLQQFTSWYLRQEPQQRVITPCSLFVTGKKMAVRRKRTDFRTGNTEKETSLFAIARENHPSYKTHEDSLEKQVTEELTLPETRSYVFSEGVSYSKDGATTLLGGLPAGALKAFALFYNTPTGVTPKSRAADEMFTDRLHRLILYYGHADSITHRTYKRKMNRFVIPVISPHTPALICTERDGDVHYELLSPENIETSLPGTELDLWFGAEKRRE